MTERVAVVTGAAAGIGAATARGLAASGYAVALLDVNECAAVEVAATIAAAGSAAVAVQCDVADEDSVRSAIAAVVERFGRIDLLHNNAAVFLGLAGGSDGLLESLDLATWRRTLDVNLTGAFLCTKYAMPHLLVHGGSVVVTASVAGALTGSTVSAYASSKAGLAGFVRSLALNYGPRGVRANAVCPGTVLTDMSEHIRQTPELQRRMIDTIPVGRMATAEDVASVVVFLASPAAEYLNGVVVPVEGGLLLT
ncbi:SDR family NAD(P)-dependent oxidoreductase [Rhodococcus koreensis]